MTLRDDLVAALEKENDDLRDRIRVLEEMVGVTFDAPLGFGLTRDEAVIFGTLVKNSLVTEQHLMTLLYGLRQDEAGIGIIKVHICRIRRKVKPFEIEVKNIWGRGYTMPADSKAIAKQLSAELAT